MCGCGWLVSVTRTSEKHLGVGATHHLHQNCSVLGRLSVPQDINPRRHGPEVCRLVSSMCRCRSVQSSRQGVAQDCNNCTVHAYADDHRPSVAPCQPNSSYFPVDGRYHWIFKSVICDCVLICYMMTNKGDHNLLVGLSWRWHRARLELPSESHGHDPIPGRGKESINGANLQGPASVQHGLLTGNRLACVYWCCCRDKHIKIEILVCGLLQQQDNIHSGMNSERCCMLAPLACRYSQDTSQHDCWRIMSDTPNVNLLAGHQVVPPAHSLLSSPAWHFVGVMLWLSR